MKPHEETWLAQPLEGWDDVYLQNDSPDPERGEDERGRRIAEVYGPDRRKLIAQAPAMARLLLAFHLEHPKEFQPAVDDVLRTAGVLP